jgi:hypothetical protein
MKNENNPHRSFEEIRGLDHIPKASLNEPKSHFYDLPDPQIEIIFSLEEWKEIYGEIGLDDLDNIDNLF